MNSAPLWTATEVKISDIGGSSLDWQAYGVAIDSRTLTPGDLFIALKGPNFDGHDYVDDAFNRGAAAAMVSEIRESWTGPCLNVEDTMTGLQLLGQAGRQRSQAQIIAITGSVGKTSSKEAMLTVLSNQAETHASLASFNNHWGVPLSLARMPRAAKFGIFELGMNHPGELGPLAKMVQPDIALITNVEPVHLAAFNSVSEIADAKAEIFSGLGNDGTVILNADNSQYRRLRKIAEARGLSVLTFGEAMTANARLIKAVVKPTCTCVAAEIMGDPVTFKVGAAGWHWAINALSILLAVKELEGDLGLAALALQDVVAIKGRGERLRVNFGAHAASLGFDLIDESYNASPVAVQAALRVLGDQVVRRHGRKIVVLGDMLELGDSAPVLHAGLADDIVAAGIDLVFACGENMGHLFAAMPGHMRATHKQTSEELITDVVNTVQPDDVIMVKGSLGSRMAPIVQALLALDGNIQSANGG